MGPISKLFLCNSILSGIADKTNHWFLISILRVIAFAYVEIFKLKLACIGLSMSEMRKMTNTIYIYLFKGDRTQIR